MSGEGISFFICYDFLTIWTLFFHYHFLFNNDVKARIWTGMSKLLDFHYGLNPIFKSGLTHSTLGFDCPAEYQILQPPSQFDAQILIWTGTCRNTLSSSQVEYQILHHLGNKYIHGNSRNRTYLIGFGDQDDTNTPYSLLTSRVTDLNRCSSGISTLNHSWARRERPNSPNPRILKADTRTWTGTQGITNPPFYPVKL